MKNLDFNPLVSIVIPVYNGENYLAEAIDSALAQTYKNIEVIVVNDGSTDRTEEIIQSYGDKVRYFKKENGGVASALNLAIKKAKGEYVSWLSHDDIYLKGKIRSQIKVIRKFQKNQKIIIFTDYFIKNTFEKNKITSSIPIKKLSASSIKTNIYDYLYILFSSQINGCTLLLKKESLIECGFFDESKSTTQDYKMWSDLIKNGYKFIHLEEKTLISRHHEKQDTLRKIELHYKELNELYIEIYDSFKHEFGNFSFEKIDSFLDVLRLRKLDSAYRHVLFMWANFGTNKKLPTIWMYWESKDGYIPDYIRLCWKTIVVNNKRDFNIICLDQYSIRKYIDDLNLNYLLYEKIAHKSDYIRFKLLEKYGGIWLDSDFISTKPLKQFIDKIDPNKLHITAYTIPFTEINFPLIGFIVCKKNNIGISLIISFIEKFIKTNLVNGVQPTWDQLGGQLILNLGISFEKVDVRKYFSPIEIWNENFSKLYANLQLKTNDIAYGQMLSASNFDTQTKIFKLNEEKLLMMNNVLGFLWRKVLYPRKSFNIEKIDISRTSQFKKMLNKIYLYPIVGPIIVRIIFRFQKIIGTYEE